MHHMHHCHPKVLNPIVSPTKHYNVHDFDKIQVPHIHPSHTTYHHHKLYEHLHTFPHTESHVTDVAHQHFNCGGAHCPPTGPIPGPMGPVPGPFGPWRR